MNNRKIRKIKGIVTFDKTYYVALNTHPKVGDVIQYRSFINKNKIIKVEQQARFDHKVFYKVLEEEFDESNPFYFFVDERI